MERIKISDYIHTVFLLRVKRRRFDWKTPHQKNNTDSEVRGTAFCMRYKKKIHLVTCFHVIEDAFHITATCPSMGSKEYECSVCWICPQLDLAVIRIKDPEHKDALCKRGLDACVFGKDSGASIAGPAIGETTYTVGFPLGQTNLKITKGILSGQQIGLYQTDAPINGGNSGGPLILDKKVLGVNASGYFLAQNVAYAIPVHRLLGLIDYHERNHNCFHIRFPRTWGLSLTPPSKLLLPCKQRPVSSKEDIVGGVEVVDVFPHQLFSDSSIKKGDIILKINGIPISSTGEMELAWMSQRMNIFSYFNHIFLGQKIMIEYMSGSKKKAIKETIQVNPESPLISYRKWYNEHETIPYVYLCGMVIVPFSANIMEKRLNFMKIWSNEEDVENQILNETIDADDSTLLRYTEPRHWTDGNVFISNIMKGSAIYNLHILKIGSIVVSINKQPIHSIDQVSRVCIEALKKKKTIDIVFHTGCTISITPEMFQKEEEYLSSIFDYKNPLLEVIQKKNIVSVVDKRV